MKSKDLKLSVSIVLFNNDAQEIKDLINAVLKTNLHVRIYLIDNSFTDQLKFLCSDTRINYIFNNKNIGYGKGHNIAIHKSIAEGYIYHLILNPDVTLEAGILRIIYDFMEDHPDAGCVVPDILYPNGKKQYLNKLYPTPFDLIIRRFLPFSFKSGIPLFRKIELKDLLEVQQVPVASGCFLFCRNKVLKCLGGFDSRYFMYLEDFDLSRRINSISKVVFLPYVSIIHGYAKGSYSHPKLLLYHIVSAIKYFNKWGWLFDKERKVMNKRILSKLPENFKQYQEIN